MTSPVLILVSGPPGAGKSTLARRLGTELGFPVFDRDDLKDAMFDTLGWSDRTWSQRVGVAAYELLYLIAGRLLEQGLSLILDTNFQRDQTLPRLDAMLQRSRFAVVEVHCQADPRLLARRFRDRWASGDRHPGHTSEFTDEEAYLKALAERGGHAAIGLGTVIEVDTTDPERVDLDDIAARIRGGIDGPDDR